MKPARIAILAGGLSLERDVSLRSGRRVAEALTERGHSVTTLDLGDELVATLAADSPDLVYLALHGKAGEDGTVQNLLDLLSVAYTGSGAVASALAWDKVVAKGLYRRAGLSTPDWVAISSSAIRDMGAGAALARIPEALGGAVVVKPAQGGAALGVRVVGGPDELPSALLTALNYADVALVERFIEGREVAVSVVDDVVLPPVEVVPRNGRYDFAARYTAGQADLHAPARLEPPILRRCEEVAASAMSVAGCRDVARADLIVDDDGTPWLLELDTCPGMTETSLLPAAAAAAGWTLPDLCERVVGAARRRQTNQR
ncbi:MAG TPA: D-alanine--D-alanine ligase [Cryptosporangiaceae bacterium]|nr:D-alanine--D-alanine ligase [Cryptosporangiaceae bacterium]